MKFNKWTLGLAAVGAISLVPAARADEKISALGTALSNTTISGYVSASMNWALYPGGGATVNSPGAGIPFQGSKQDGFNLDVVKISIAKPEDESPWASGYQIDLMFGPDAVGYNTAAFGSGSGSTEDGFSDFAIKQAYVTLRTPVGNGIDWKIGVFDTIIGYEVTDAGSNPNYTRSWGYAIEPTEHTGVLATYKVNDQWSFSAGIANTLSAGINTRDLESGFSNGAGSDWHKTYMGSLTYAAPMSWGWAAGSSLYAGVVYGFAGATRGYMDGNQVNYYGGATLNTPWKQVTTGFAFDFAQNLGGGSEGGNFYQTVNVMALGFYGTYKATDKLSINGRAEYVYGEQFTRGSDSGHGDGFEVTGTVEYDLWANVISRLELRWDRVTTGSSFLGGSSSNSEEFVGFNRSSVGLYANVIYKF
jgi:Putative beta-barrel porin-2, OmpL-like. bbp2